MINTYIKIGLLTIIQILARVVLVIGIAFAALCVFAAIHAAFENYPKFSFGLLLGALFTAWFIQRYNYLLRIHRTRK